MNTISEEPWVRRAVLGILVLVVLTPVLGWASGVVGYTEPLENAAGETGAADAASSINPSIFPDYLVPGLSSPLGKLVSAVVGMTLTLAVAIGAGRLLEQ